MSGMRECDGMSGMKECDGMSGMKECDGMSGMKECDGMSGMKECDGSWCILAQVVQHFIPRAAVAERASSSSHTAGNNYAAPVQRLVALSRDFNHHLYAALSLLPPCLKQPQHSAQHSAQHLGHTRKITSTFQHVQLIALLSVRMTWSA
jgi:hypothetical protein